MIDETYFKTAILEGLKDDRAEIRRMSAELLKKFDADEVLAALREANVTESNAVSKLEILKSMVELEKRRLSGVTEKPSD